ncbi:MAG: COR domain-containing protein, partial [Bacteroidota bacterium]
MNAKDLQPILEKALGFELTLIEDIQACLDDPDRYPDSYREVMSIEEEMVGSMYAKHIFSDTAGNLVGLNLFGCEITDEELPFFEDEKLKEGLSSLKSLNLSQTHITRFTLSEDLTELVFVCMNEMEHLERLVCRKNLKSLARLELSETQISQLEIPQGYDSLYYVDLSTNPKLETFQFSGACKNLQLIFLRGTAIKEFILPSGFEKLVHLYLNDNQLEELTLKSKLPQLSTLQLKNNKLKAIPENTLTLAPVLDSIFLGNNPLPEELSNLLESISDQNHIDLYKEYLAQRQIGKVQPNNECKVLLIGNGKAGKSAIVNRIVFNRFDPEWDSTHGISLFQKEYDKYLLNFWDFGGQDLYHATHRLFMQQNAVYILAWSKETEKPFTEHKIILEDGSAITRNYKNHAIRYWLEYAKHLGKESPMNVVQTKIEKDGKQDKSELANYYEDVFQPEVAFHAIESKEDSPFYNGYGDGKDGKLLHSILKGVAHLKEDETIAGPLFEIRKYLREEQVKGRKTMPYEEYLAKAEELEVLRPKEMLENWLFKTGVVYYRPGKFNNTIILNQGWAIEAIYTLFDRSKGTPFEIEANKGVFDGALLQRVWQKDYPDQDTQELFVSFMLSCDLCFEIDTGKEDPSFQDRTFMAPQLLVKKRPETIDDFWEGREAIYYRYSDEFIHEGVIHSFIVKTAYLATLRDVWRIGIQIKEEEQYAWVEAGVNELNIRLSKNAEGLLFKIRNLLQELQGGKGREEISEDGINFQEMGAYPFGSEEEGLAMRGMLRQKGLRSIKEQETETLLEKDFKENQPMPTTQEDREEIEILKSTVKNLEKKVIKIEEYQHPPMKTILFISASPKGPKTPNLDTRSELDDLVDELKKGKASNSFMFDLPKMALSESNFLRIEDAKPHVLHFSGHGDEKGIYIMDEYDNPYPVPTKVLSFNLRGLEG